MPLTAPTFSDALPEPHGFFSARALYAPPALRRFTQLQGVTDPKEIALERHRQRLNIRKVNDDPPPRRVHRHFITEVRDRRLATAEAIGDIRDTTTGMDHVSDVLFVGFVIRPEWDLSQPLDPTNIDIEVVTSHHVKQHHEYQRTVDELRKIVQKQIAFPHIYTYHSRLRAVTPGYGYAVDPETGRLCDNEIRLAQGVQPPLIIGERLGTPSTALRTSTLARSSLSTHESSRSGQTNGPASRRQEMRNQPPSHLRGLQAPLAEPVLMQTRRGPRWVRLRQPQLSTTPIPSSNSLSSSNVPVVSATAQSEPVERTHNGTQASTATSSPPLSLDFVSVRPTSRTSRRRLETAMAPIPMAQLQEPIVVSDSESDESIPLTAISNNTSDSESDHSALIFVDLEDQESDVESWVRTPEGSPPRRLSHRVQVGPTSSIPSVSLNTHLDDPPPEYTTYLQPTIESFGFHPRVAQFLLSRNLSPSGLVRVDSTLDFHVSDWSIGFLEAGLSENDAQELQTVVLQSLPELTREALIMAWVAEDS
ncbi:hypothetical protein BDY19DRAFT_910664 [Irpex rosettiformis]|uniref:Uncharacterized protein n=1 Tax=Irpex rosettiformis TaxID=378272 RepID=A0ACB8TMW6_9APHY|nr:hypothetical protein BDY19DRAFT_910664 [Irpex rosettiformis]